VGQVIDNRVDLYNGSTAPDDLAGSAGGTADTDVFIRGTQSYGQITSTSRLGLMYDAGAAQDWSDNIFYYWVNCGVVPLLDTQTLGGFTIRFCGATVTDWFEVYVGGSDFWPKAVQGGWVMFVVDIERARDIATGVLGGSPIRGGTNGTPPATSAIRYTGFSAITASVMPKHVENTWIDSVWRVPRGTPGIVVEGDNTGSPYNWQDVLDASDFTDPTKAWGTAKDLDGVIFLNTLVQFGNNGSPTFGTHDFEDANKVFSFEEQEFVADDVYGFQAVGDPSGTQRLIAGVNGSAGQGWTILASPIAPRWSFTATDPDIDQVGLYGCSFTHTSVIDIDNVNVDVYDSLLIDGQRLYHSRTASPRSGADFQRNAIITADPIYGEGSPAAITSPANRAYLWTADPDKLIDNTFNYFTGHAMNITEAGTYSFVGNIFDSLWENGTSPDGNGTLEAALYSAATGIVELDISGGGNTPTAFPTPISIPIEYSDNFDRISGDSLGVDWTYPGDDFEWRHAARIVQGKFGTTSLDGTRGALAVRTAETYSSDQYCEVEVGGFPQGGLQTTSPDWATGVDNFERTGVGVRWTTDFPSPLYVGYYVVVDFFIQSPYAGPGSPNTPEYRIRMYRYDGSESKTQIGISSGFGVQGGVMVGDTLRLEALGSTLTAYFNGVERLSVTDSTYTGGAPALMVATAGGTSLSPPNSRDKWDNWVGGDLLSGASFVLNNNVSVTITDIVPGTEVRVYPVGSPLDTTEIAGIESTGSPSEFTFSAEAGLVVRIVVFHLDYVLPPANEFELTIPTTDTSFPISQIIDRNYLNP
jgi:hypothetical protein